MGCAGQADRPTQTAEAELACGDLEPELLARPLYVRDDVVAVEPVYEIVGKQRVQRIRGAEIALRAREGMSAPWLSRVAACRASATSQGAEDSALGVPGVQVRVDERGSTYRLVLTSDEVERAREIWERARG